MMEGEKMKQETINAARNAARQYLEFRRAMNSAGMIQAEAELFGAIGYWRQPRVMTAGQFRGERGLPRMARRPNGARAIRWDAEAAATVWAVSR